MYFDFISYLSHIVLFKIFFFLKVEIYKLYETKINSFLLTQRDNFKSINMNKNNKDKKTNIRNKNNKSRTKKSNQNLVKKNEISINSLSKYNLKKYDTTISNNNFKNNIKENDNNNEEEDDNADNYLFYNDFELNSLIYEKALKSDKRTYFQYYISLLRTNHLLIFPFYYNNKDYNSQIIKIFLFFFFFAVYLTINALFFDDDTLHQIYIDKGSFNFIYRLPAVLCSALISAVVNTIIRYLSLSQKKFLRIKSEQKIENLRNKVIEVLNSLKINFALFFIITFILLLLFLYYITCFCGIYINT